MRTPVKHSTAAACGLALAVLLTGAAAQAQPLAERLWQWVVAAGGGQAADPAPVSLQATVGQSVVGQQSGPDRAASFGYWQPGLTVVGVADEAPALPEVTRLRQNAPNPFNPSTTIRFDLAHDGRVRIRVYDLRGRQVAEVLDAELPAGRHRVNFAPRDLASGVYFYELRHGGTREVRRLTLVK